ncbi:MAG TPA: hypothetical protein VEI97_20070, partial [bacterium]|nr:hypothetical protein [bacterium]
ELVDDFEVLASFNDHHNDYPSAHHIVFSPTINKLVVQSVIDAPTTAPGYPINDGRSRYRTYSLTP